MVALYASAMGRWCSLPQTPEKEEDSVMSSSSHLLLLLLCRGLCWHVQRSVAFAVAAAAAGFHPPTDTQDYSASVRHTLVDFVESQIIHVLAMKLEATKLRELCHALRQIASEPASPTTSNTCNNNSETTTDLVLAAIAIGSALEFQSNISSMGGAQEEETDKRGTWWLHRLLSHSTLVFSTVYDLVLCSKFISHHVSAVQWTDTVLPALSLKVKSHPDRALATVHGWILNSSSIAAPRTTNLQPSWTAMKQQSELVVMDSDWSTLLIKHLTSTKSSIIGTEETSSVLPSALAASILLEWANVADMASRPVALALVAACSTHKPPLLAPARVVVYRVLRQLATQLYNSVDGLVGDDADGVEYSTVDQVLKSLVPLVEKETKSEHQYVGLEAVVEWIILAKKMQMRSKNQVDPTEGYKMALRELIQLPITQAKKTTIAMMVFNLLVERLPSDSLPVLESITIDFWLVGDKLWDKGLEALQTNASNKKSQQLDGILIIYFCLVFATSVTSGLSQAKTILPGWCTKVVAAGAAKGNNRLAESFLFAPPILELIASNQMVGTVFPRILALYTQIHACLSSKNNGEGLAPIFQPTDDYSATVAGTERALAICILYSGKMTSPTQSSQTQMDSRNGEHNPILKSLESILTLHTGASRGMVYALYEQVNVVSSQRDDVIRRSNETRDARESESGISSNSLSNENSSYDSSSVRRAAKIMARHGTKSQFCQNDAVWWAMVLSLMHTGSSLKSHGHQRAALIHYSIPVMQDILSKILIPSSFRSEVALEIIRITVGTVVGHIAADSVPNAPSNYETKATQSFPGASLRLAAHSLLVTLGSIASRYGGDDDESQVYQFVNKMCVEDIVPLLSHQLNGTLQRVESLTGHDIDLFESSCGSLVRIDIISSQSASKTSRKPLNDEEEWELQLKKTLAEKKVGGVHGFGKLTPEEETLLAQQDIQRRSLSFLLNVELESVIQSIRLICLSDIEFGNECLPLLADNVIAAAVSDSPAFARIQRLRTHSFDVLSALSTCVCEIHENLAPSIATALSICYRKSAKTAQMSLTLSPEAPNMSIRVSALPSPCLSASCVITAMDEFRDVLSGTSFVFLFPIIQAVLMGPRTTVGCEAALRVLKRHTDLLVGDDFDQHVRSIRKAMVVSVLDLLKHDRAQTFINPTPFETLVACYRTDQIESPGHSSLTTAELAPLLDERAALGSKNCRIGSMICLAQLAIDHRNIIKMNPLAENRIWINCFDRDVDIRSHALKAWAAVHDCQCDHWESDGASMPKPSPLFATPLLPLLSHSNASISLSAADAFACAMGLNPASVSRNMETLCLMYIDAFPIADVAIKTPTVPNKAKPLTASTTKKIATTLPKKKVVVPQKSALAVAGIGQAKVSIKKKSSHAAFLTPKQERTLDQEELASQFTSAGIASPLTKKEQDSPAKIAIRKGVLRVVAALSVSSVKVQMDESTLKLLTSFLMAYGIADDVPSVQGAARDALRDVVASNGGSDQVISFLLPHLEAVLKTGAADESTLGNLPNDKVPKDVLASDRRKEGAVVALGSVALHLKGDENDDKVANTVDMLFVALNTPSEEVQVSVAEALTKLMKKGRTQERIETILSSLLRNCLFSDSLATRRGAAYGLSATVKGSGITTLKKFEVVKQLEDACANGTHTSKEGSLFAIELLSSRLGLLFEPYVIVLLPSLLKAFSDSNDHVRTAASNTSGIIMSKLSAHGVKLVMPAVLTAFNDPAWRTKQASIHMLGAMSHLAPKQLASALPKVVPQLTAAFSDTHTKVKASAQEALNEISTVVKNPEISSICPILLKALTDPAAYTVKALEVLIGTEFLHAIDAPSLALIVPILHRGLRDRGATTKRFGSLIAGNICSMINDPKDFVPYLPTLLPDLQSSLLDPIPDVRSTSAKALGSLTRSLGEHIFNELRPWLIKMLRDTMCSTAERSGAAQGLTEVLIASGTAAVEDTMRNEILPLRSYPDACTREGVLWMLTFLPSEMGQGYSTLIDVSLPALISGLSDDSEPVRDVALRAGRVLIRSHGKVHVDKILPSLEAGLSDSDHRIRVASLSLLGDLLSTIGGTQLLKGEGDTQDDLRKAERAQAQIALVLGAETRKRVLSGLYLARSDSVHMVRQSAIQVWKTVVSVTVRSLRDILPVLVAKVIDDLASGHEEKTDVAGRCLGDIVSKLGDSVLPQIIPVLRNALYDGDEQTRRGVCVGLTEVIQCSNKEQILRFVEIIVKVVQDALCDDDETVRKMAAISFQSLHAVVGSRAMDEVVPSLLVTLENGERDEIARFRALNGLTGILTVRSRELLPYIVPRLIKRPITTNHAEVLAGVARVTGSTIHHHFSSIVPALLNELAECDDDEEKEQAIRECTRVVCSSVDSTGVNWLIGEIASKCGSDKAALRRESCRMFENVVLERKLCAGYAYKKIVTYWMMLKTTTIEDFIRCWFLQ